MFRRKLGQFTHSTSWVVPLPINFMEKNEFIFRDAIAPKILVYLRNNSRKKNYPTSIAKDLKILHGNMTKKAIELEALGFLEVVKDKDSRKKCVQLTEKGKTIVDYITEINEVLG